ncbi:MAG: hypothetical protein WBC63_02155 [Candidatus Bipolaricaulia bacterium]
MSSGTELRPLERWTMVVGFVLSAVVIGVVAASYLLNMQFQYLALVWIIGIAFGAVALLLVMWPLTLRGRLDDPPTGRLRALLILAVPIAFVLDS